MPLTSYSRPFGIHNDGKVDIVPGTDEREDVVYIDLVPREDLLRVDTGHQDRCIISLSQLTELRKRPQARLG